ncbi:MAG: hypothetical protein BWY54_00322 [Candidatus Dependentiae bacterium ADurb.Bin331]|nr:MAG: hypothetical protein BWY54_00322 [Candidatus Dependentiae bacterium ADurb.Bin331]
MEILQALERKIAQLIALTNELKSTNSRLAEENEQLLQKLTTVQSEELNQERLRTKLFVDDLIKSIDSLVGNEKSS